MDGIPFYIVCDHHYAAANKLDHLQEKLEYTKEDAIRMRARFLAALNKRGMDPADDAAIKRAATRDKHRDLINDEICTAMMDAADSWIFHEETDRFQADQCSNDECWYQIHPEKRDEFTGFFESAYLEDAREGRYCDMCFRRLPDPVEEAVAMRRTTRINMSVEDILLRESRIHVGGHNSRETAAERAARAQIADEWRTLAPPIHCVVCDDAKTLATRCQAANPRAALCARTDDAHAKLFNDPNFKTWVPTAHFQGCIACAEADTPATHLLVAWPSIRLCDVHFAGRAELKGLLLCQAGQRLRIEQ